MRLGPHELSSNLFLSPLAGYTNLPMRLTLRELGGLGWATTDLVNARSLLERNPAALKLVATSLEDRPMAIQLFGSVPEEMRDAAAMCEALGAQGVDINMGCPVKKVVKIGGGSAMMTELEKTAALVRGMIGAMDFGRAKRQFGEGKFEQCGDFGAGPVGASPRQIRGTGAGRHGRCVQFAAPDVSHFSPTILNPHFPDANGKIWQFWQYSVAISA